MVTKRRLTRRAMVGGSLGLAAAGRGLAATALTLPKDPVELTIVDAGGSLQMTRQGFDLYASTHPNLVSRISYTTSPPAQLAGKVHAEQAGGSVDIDLCLCGNDSLAAGLAEDLWLRLLPDYAAKSSGPGNDLSARRLEDAGPSRGTRPGCGVQPLGAAA